MAETSEYDVICFVCRDTFWAKDLMYMPCRKHRYCDDCFCSGVERAIAKETQYPIPCGTPAECPHPSLPEVEAMLNSFPDIDGSRREDLIAKYASQIIEYDTPPGKRTYCKDTECLKAKGHSRFLDPNICGLGDGLRVRCPDCDSATCTKCKRILDGVDAGSHRCQPDARDVRSATKYIESLPDDQKWQWQKCGGCGLWAGKEGEDSCNHMLCYCTFQFCLICGRKWEGLTLCTHGCPKTGRALYDADGYNQVGYHRDTGLSRGGVPRPINALPSEESAVAVAVEVDEDGGDDDGDEYDDSNEEVGGGVLQGWNYDPFDDADLDNEGWDNSTWGRNGGTNFLHPGDPTEELVSGLLEQDDDGHSIPIPAGLLEYTNGGFGIRHRGFTLDDRVADEDDPTNLPEEVAGDGHTYKVPYLSRFVSPETFIKIPLGMPKWHSLLTDWKYLLLLSMYAAPIFMPNGFVVWFHNKLESMGFAYNGWGMDHQGYDFYGYNYYGINRQGRDRNGLNEKQKSKTLGRKIWF